MNPACVMWCVSFLAAVWAWCINRVNVGKCLCVASTLQPSRGALGWGYARPIGQGNLTEASRPIGFKACRAAAFTLCATSWWQLKKVGRSGWPAVGDGLFGNCQRFDVGRNLTPQSHKRTTTTQRPRLISTPRHCYCGHQTIERAVHDTQFTSPSVSFIFPRPIPHRRFYSAPCNTQISDKLALATGGV
jgi:hypothetical protein